MSELNELRNEIDVIDRQMMELFRRRMDVTRQVGEYKLAHGLPVLDQARERQVLAEKAALAGPELAPAAVRLYQTVMALSRRQQRDLTGEGAYNPGLRRFKAAMSSLRQPVEDPRVVYQGVPGAYSEQASLDWFGPAVNVEGLEQFEDCFLALKEGRADYAVLPIENSSTGAIRQIYDLLTRYEFYLVGETTVRVEHCLMAPKGATLDTITHVYSHEQGLFQCEQYLNTHPDWHQVPQADTAGSAQMVAASGDVTKAAICSARAAEIYGLEILDRGINHNSHNTTRFVVVSPKPELREGGWHGFNTDGAGCLAALEETGLWPAERVLLLGAGGAARAVGRKLAACGAAVTVCNRTLSRAEELCAGQPGMAAAPWTELDRLCAGADLLVNCTDLGMAGCPAFGSLDFLDRLPAGAGVFDLIYHPAETALLARAKELGHPCSNGLPMLVHQAIYALELFLDRPLDHAAMGAVVRKALEI